MTNDRTMITEDGKTVRQGDRAFNYYDRKWCTIGEIDAQGWATCAADDGTSAALNGERLATYDPNGTTDPTAVSTPTPVSVPVDPAEIVTIETDGDVYDVVVTTADGVSYVVEAVTDRDDAERVAGHLRAAFASWMAGR